MKVLRQNIPLWPEYSEIGLAMRPLLEPRFRALKTGISEFTFANIFLFRKVHRYRITDLGEGLFLISGVDKGEGFFILPFLVPDMGRLMELFDEFTFMKNASAAQAATLGSMGFGVKEDKDNFDYLYLRDGLASLKGRKFHRKRNRVSAFTARYECVSKPISAKTLNDALSVLDGWCKTNEQEGDCGPAAEALLCMSELSLMGYVYYIGKKPVAYALGEALPGGAFAVHFEKGLPGYAGLLQFVNQSFAKALPEKYKFINREQDLGIEGLRHAKLSYRPHGFVKKYRIYKAQAAGDDSP